MKILSKNTSLLPPASIIPPFHILFTPLFHFLPLLVLFHSFSYFILVGPLEDSYEQPVEYPLRFRCSQLSLPTQLRMLLF